MIVDSITHLSKYAAINPRIAQVISYLETTHLEELTDGIHQIDGDEVFVNVMTIQGKAISEAPMEYHHKMIDIQIPISGDETYGYQHQDQLPNMVYDESKDMAIQEGVSSQMYLSVKKGQFILFLPEEGHAPGISDASYLKKAIFKIKA